LVIDFKTREVTRNHKLVKLTKTEFDLLAYLAKNQDRVVTHTMILNHVWGYASDIESRVVDVYISYLRKKIDRDAAKKLIHTKRGVGYYFKIA
jgi:DNA-binding response OmpR family regulator